MSNKGPVIYGLESQGRALTARALASRPAETENIHFFCGTQSLRQDNQVHLLEYDEEKGVLDKTVYLHPEGEIWHLSSSPLDKDVLCSCYETVVDGQIQNHCALWRIVDEEDTPLDKIATLEHGCRNFRSSAWHPASLPQLATVDEADLCLWKMAGASVELQRSISLDGKSRSSWSSLAWNPHHNSSQILCSCDSTLRAHDTRSTRISFSLDQIHGPCVRGVDFNPNKPYHFASCGDDCCVRFWDSRQLSSPLLTRHDHSHWVWSVQFNLFHDQLVLSSSSDSQVLLTRLASIASEPLQHLLGEEEEADEQEVDGTPVGGSIPPDKVIAKFEEHEDSVYCAVWSWADAWVFASLSYDGRLIIHHVPQQEKFSILTS